MVRDDDENKDFKDKRFKGRYESNVAITSTNMQFQMEYVSPLGVEQVPFSDICVPPKLCVTD